MKKIPYTSISNDFCPQTLFLYGTWNDDGTPDFGLFCWFSYTWDGDAKGVMACIGGSKTTKEHIKKTGMFSANLVTEDILAFADKCGCTSGSDPAKRLFMPECGRGEKLNVPILPDAHLSYELRVIKETELDGSDLYICHVENVLTAEYLLDTALSNAERLKICAPVRTTCGSYFAYDGHFLGEWGSRGLPPAEFAVRPFEEKDRDGMIYMILRARDKIGSAIKIRADLLDIKGEYSGDFWVAADKNDKIAGSVGIKAGQNGDMWLKRLFVDPDLWRCGIGTALLAQAESAAKAKGAKRLHTRFAANHTQAAKFYPARGFEHEKTDNGITYMVKNI